MKRKTTHPPEYAEQAALVRWFRLQYPHLQKLLIANLNGAKLAPVEGRAFAHLPEGVRRGIAWTPAWSSLKSWPCWPVALLQACNESR